MIFETWWENAGSAMRPTTSEDVEEHTKRVALAAWIEASKRVDGLEYAIREALEYWDDNAHNSVRNTLQGAIE
jgi:hypothetical protein